MKRDDEGAELHVRLGSLELRVPASMMLHFLLLVAMISPVLAIYLMSR
jgi:hypothetical protein